MKNAQSIAADLIRQKPTPTAIDESFITPESANNGEGIDDGNTPDGSTGFGDGKSSAGIFGRESDPNAGRLRDSSGAPFDSSIHATDEHGKPKRTKTGRFRKRRGANRSNTGGPVDDAKRLSCREAGQATAQAIFMTGQTLFGEEWAPIVEPDIGLNEPENMTTAWAAYYEQTGMRNPPPWLVVVLACGAYAAPRINQPKTQSRLKRFTKNVVLYFQGWRKRKGQD